MTSFKVVHSEAEDWVQAAKKCADEFCQSNDAYTLGFIYVTDNLAENLASILTYLRKETGIQHWVGSVGVGICAVASNNRYGSAEYFDQGAMAVMAMALPTNTFQVLPTIESKFEELPSETLNWIDESGSLFGVVHGDPANVLVPSLIEELTAKTSGFLVGGLTSSRTQSYQVADQVTSGGLSGVMFSPSLEVVTCLSQGCVPLEGSHLISDCIDNIVIGLDGRAALEVFKEDIGEELVADLAQVPGLVHAALPIEGSDTGDYLVRPLVGIDDERGWLAIGEHVETGQRIFFVRRDPLSAEIDMRNRLENLKKRFGKKPRAALYYTCVGRGPSMFGIEGHELSIIEDVFSDVPLIGFFGNGEISYNRLYGYTGVLTLIA
jgi:small ligand-binding sensory domain FIST